MSIITAFDTHGGGEGRGGRNLGLMGKLKDPTPWKISYKLINNYETQASKIKTECVFL
jgi:hypothetical protein